MTVLSSELPDLAIDRRTLDSMLAHIRNGLPYESCGLLATTQHLNGGRIVRRFFPGDNADRSATRFTMDPRQVTAALEEIDQLGWELGAIVHSHPYGPPTPSITDLREVFYPNAWMVIVSFASEQPDVRLWRFVRSERILPAEIALSIFPE